MVVVIIEEVVITFVDLGDGLSSRWSVIVIVGLVL